VATLHITCQTPKKPKHRNRHGIVAAVDAAVAKIGSYNGCQLKLWAKERRQFADFPKSSPPLLSPLLV
jgi:hypothetical protein